MDTNQIPTTADIGRAFRELRVNQGLDIAELARRSRRSVELIDAFESGRTAPSLEDLFALADALGVSMAMACRLAETGRLTA